MGWFKKKNCKKPDLESFDEKEGNLFVLGRKEWMMIYGSAVGLDLFLAVTFFQSFIAMLILSPLMFFYVRYMAEHKKRRKKQELEVQFKDAMFSIAASLQAGYSLDHAFAAALEISTTVYGEKSMIAILFKRIVCGRNLNIPMQSLLMEFQQRSQLELAESFTEVIVVTRQYGGNLPDMIQKLAEQIEDQIAIKSEVLSVTTSIRYEAYIMDFIPPAIIWYMNITGPEFLQCLYEGVTGRGIMALCLFAYLGIVFWQLRIMEHMTEMKTI